MLQLFRNFFKSKIGIGVTLLLLGIIALAFASGDVANTGTFGGVAGGDRVATVGDAKIGTADLNRAATDTLQRIKQNDPTLTMEYFVREGGLDNTLDDLIDRHALAEFARIHGLRAGSRLIDSEIAMIPAFRGANGKFDETAYRQAIQQQGLTDAMIREDLVKGLTARQVLVPAGFGVAVPQKQVENYAVLLKERRKGSIAVMPSVTFAPKKPPTDAQLSEYYAKKRDDFTRPERRTIRYATFGADALGDLRSPTDAEIAARFKRDAETYAATENRSISQVIVPTKAAAQTIATEVRSGVSLENSAKSKGLAVAKLTSLDKAALTKQSSEAVANAAFSVARGKITDPARSNLGWHVIRVDTSQTSPARSLDQVRGQIVKNLGDEQRNAALADLSTGIEEKLDEGASLAETARELGLELKTTKPVTADGLVYPSTQETAPAVLAPAFSTAFAMEEGEPQLTEIVPGTTFLMFEIAEITPSAPAPLSEIKDAIKAAWVRSEGSAAAKEAAGRVLAKLEKGTSLATALAAEKKPLPRPDNVNLGLEDLRKMGERPPAPIVLMFSMAEGTSKRLEAPGDNGWFIVHLADIVPGKLDPKDPTLELTRRQLSGNIASEYRDQMVKAIRAELGVKRNQAGLDAVRRQLTGGE